MGLLKLISHRWAPQQSVYHERGLLVLEPSRQGAEDWTPVPARREPEPSLAGPLPQPGPARSSSVIDRLLQIAAERQEPEEEERPWPGSLHQFWERQR